MNESQGGSPKGVVVIEGERYVTIPAAARLCRVSHQAIYQARMHIPHVALEEEQGGRRRWLLNLDGLRTWHRNRRRGPLCFRQRQMADEVGA